MATRRSRAGGPRSISSKKKTAAKAESGQGAAKNDPTVPLKNRATPPLHIKLQTLRYVSRAFALRRDGIHALCIVSRHRKRALRFASGSSCVIHAAAVNQSHFPLGGRTDADADGGQACARLASAKVPSANGSEQKSSGMHRSRPLHGRSSERGLGRGRQEPLVDPGQCNSELHPTNCMPLSLSHYIISPEPRTTSRQRGK